MARCSEDDVRAIIEVSLNPPVNLRPFIEAAKSLTDHVETKDADSILGADALRQIETWLAAHFYAIRDQQYAEKSTEKASGTFQGKTDMYLSSTQWGQQAMILDVTGRLAKLNKEMTEGGKRRIQMHWLGKARSAQIDYDDRN